MSRKIKSGILELTAVTVILIMMCVITSRLVPTEGALSFVLRIPVIIGIIYLSVLTLFFIGFLTVKIIGFVKNRGEEFAVQKAAEILASDPGSVERIEKKMAEKEQKDAEKAEEEKDRELLTALSNDNYTVLDA